MSLSKSTDGFVYTIIVILVFVIAVLLLSKYDQIPSPSSIFDESSPNLLQRFSIKGSYNESTDTHFSGFLFLFFVQSSTKNNSTEE